METNQVTALDQLRCYLYSHDITGIISDADRVRHFRIFELCTAYELNLLIWECLPPVAFDGCVIPLQRFAARGSKPQDYGIDCASLDLSNVAQAKWYAPGRSISFGAISTHLRQLRSQKFLHYP